MTVTHIWLRAETKAQEQRTALPPSNAKKLIDAGYKVTVEKSTQSIFNDDDYFLVGCEIAEPGSWVEAPEHAIILGLKELPEASFPLTHRHIYFAHAYKEQSGWEHILGRFKEGKGKLFDLEFLLDGNNRRIAAFGYCAGFAGAALAVKSWIEQQSNEVPALTSVNSYNNKEELLQELKTDLSKFKQLPNLMVIGAKGRSGSGAIDLAKALDIETIGWDIEETQKGGPFKEINDANIFVNCVLINQDLPPFVTQEMLSDENRNLSVIADVSCDPYGSYNPLPIYNQCTTFKFPSIAIKAGEKPLELIAIDHLPSLLPKESSEDYSNQLLPYLVALNDENNPVWNKALEIFDHHCGKI